MRIERVELANFGPHRNLECNLDRRLTGIVGRNGSGKTAVMDALELLVTGTIPRAGVKDANIRHRADPKEVSRVVGHLVHGPHTLHVVRGLRRAKTELTIDGGKPILGELAVNAEIAALIGGAVTLFGEYVFVRQGQTAAFLDATASRRDEVYRQLFGLGRAAEAHEAVGRRLMGLMTTPDRTADIDAARRRTGDLRESLAALRAERARFADRAEYFGVIGANQAVLDRRRDHLRARAAVKAAIAERDEIDRVLDLARADAAVANTAHHDARRALDRKEAEIARAADLARQHDAYDAYGARADVLVRRRARLVADRDGLSRPTKPKNYVPAEAHGAVLADADQLRDEVAAIAPFVAAFDAGVVACPTCGTPSDDPRIATRLEHDRARLAKMQARLTKRQDALVQSAAYDVVRRDYDRAVHDLELRIEEVGLELDALDKVDCPDGDRPDLPSRQEADRKLLRAGAVAASSAERVRQLTGQAAQVRKRLKEARAAARESAVSRDESRAAKATLAVATARLHERGEVVGRIHAEKSALAAAEADLGRLRAEAAAGGRVRAAAGHLEAMRQVLDRSALPRVVAGGYLGLIERGVNATLDRFDAGFRVRTATDMALEAVFHGGPDDGVVQPAARLSGGQKVLLALAFRAEVNALFAGDIGLLCLDEPTAALDARNAARLDVVLDKLRSLADSHGLQCILITHETGLARLFDGVVDLDARA